MESYDRLIKLVESAAEDIQKAEGGNKAAGTRARKIMQDVKNAAQDVRKEILELRDQDQGSGGGGGSTPGSGPSPMPGRQPG